MATLERMITGVDQSVVRMPCEYMVVIKVAVVMNKVDTHDTRKIRSDVFTF